MTAPKRRNGLLKGGAMSEELRGSHYGANDEPGDEVEAHGNRAGLTDEADDDEVEGHANRVG